MAQTVLVVEDEVKIRELRSYLERAGLDVVTTGSGAEAITLAARAEPDLAGRVAGRSPVASSSPHHDLPAVLIVADTGPGIEPDELPHLFDRFWRGRAAAGTPGSGVGLTVVAELVRAHRGRIEVAGTPETGTAFTVCLPEAA